MKSNIIKFFIFFLLFGTILNVSATIKCDSGKPGSTVSCVVTKASEYSGTVGRIKYDTGLTFDSCDVCSGESYTIGANKSATFKFKIDASIVENKILNVSIANESSSISVKIDGDTNPSETAYTVILIPGNNQSNITKSCTVNSLNSTCNVTLDDLTIEGFNGWGAEKDCTEGAKGNIKVNKDVTYYACYKTLENENNDDNNNNDDNDNENSANINIELLLKSLIIKNNEEEMDFGFSIRVKEYDVTVPLDTESLVVEAIAQDEEVEVKIEGNENLSEENNKIVVILTDKEGNASEYIINVLKNDEKVLPLLSNLIIGGYTIDFHPEKFVYSVTIDQGIKELNIEKTPENEDYEVQVLGNENLKDGSQIKIVVSNDSVSSTYTIIVNQDSSPLLMYLAIGGIVLIILIVLLIVVVKKGRKNNKSNNVNSNNSKTKVTAGKKVSSNNTIPEVKPVIPAAPINDSVSKEKEDIETLDF